MRYIYIAKAVGHEDIYKVGRSFNPWHRVKVLKSEYGCEFELLHQEIESGPLSEASAHRILHQHKSGVFGEDRREVFNANYKVILNAVARACSEKINDELEFMISTLPLIMAQAGEESCIHNGRYKVVPMGDGVVAISYADEG